MSWFDSLIQPEPGDDSLPLLSITNKPYRALILANPVSIFDFRSYLLARQCRLLAKMGKLQSWVFPRTLAKQLREAQVVLMHILQFILNYNRFSRTLHLLSSKHGYIRRP